MGFNFCRHTKFVRVGGPMNKIFISIYQPVSNSNQKKEKSMDIKIIDKCFQVFERDTGIINEK